MRPIIFSLLLFFFQLPSLSHENENISSLIAAAIKNATNTDIAIINEGAIKKTEVKKIQNRKEEQKIEKLTPEELTPFYNDKIVILKIKGNKIKEMLERSYLLYPKRSINYLYTAGIDYKFDKDKKPNERISQIKVNNQPLNEDKEYTLSTYLFLVSAKLGYYRIFNKSHIIKYTNITIEKALIKFMKKR